MENELLLNGGGILEPNILCSCQHEEKACLCHFFRIKLGKDDQKENL